MTNTAPKKRKLGRGLNSLLQSTPTPQTAAPPPTTPAPAPRSTPHLEPGSADSGVDGGADTSNAVRSVPLKSITPSPFQPRRVFDDEELEQLSASIAEHGLLQPIILRTLNNGAFELIAGERRWRAAGLAGLSEIPAIVRDVDDTSAATIALIENVQRSDLNPVDRAMALRSLVERFGLTQQQVSERVGLDRATVANLIRVTDLDESVLSLLRNGRLNTGHAKALLGCPAGKERSEIAERCANEEWSVRRAEREVKSLASSLATPSKPSPKAPSPDITSLERHLSEHLGAKVSVRVAKTGDRGELRIGFVGLDHFDGILEKFGFRMDAD